jgi:hypothetical protein
MFKTISLLLNWNLKHLHTCLKKKVFYSFHSFQVGMHQVLNVLISVDYILNIIKIKIPLLQAQVTIPKFWYPVDTCWPSCFQRLLNYFGFQSYDYECTLWRLFQKHFVISKFDICICILWFFFFFNLINSEAFCSTSNISYNQYCVIWDCLKNCLYVLVFEK